MSYARRPINIIVKVICRSPLREVTALLMVCLRLPLVIVLFAPLLHYSHFTLAQLYSKSLSCINLKPG